MNVTLVSAYPHEDEVVLTPYYRYIYLNKIDIYNSPNKIYIYAILPTDLVIPKLYSEFFEWNKKLRTSQSGGKNLLSLKLNNIGKKLNGTINNKLLNRKRDKMKTRKHHKPRKHHDPMTKPNTSRFTDPLPSFRGKEPTKEEREVIEHMKQSVMKRIESMEL
jgi:hypothetical protein